MFEQLINKIAEVNEMSMTDKAKTFDALNGTSKEMLEELFVLYDITSEN